MSLFSLRWLEHSGRRGAGDRPHIPDTSEGNRRLSEAGMCVTPDRRDGTGPGDRLTSGALLQSKKPKGGSGVISPWQQSQVAGSRTARSVTFHWAGTAGA